MFKKKYHGRAPHPPQNAAPGFISLPQLAQNTGATRGGEPWTVACFRFLLARIESGTAMPTATPAPIRPIKMSTVAGDGFHDAT